MTVEFMIFAVCIVVCSCRAYYIGIGKGHEEMFWYLEDVGTITVEEVDEDEDE